MTIAWSDDQTFILDGVTFSTVPGRGDLVALKTHEHTNLYERLVAQVQPRRILELGIYRGGSIGLLALLAQPERLVGVDLRPDCPPLDAFIARHRMTNVEAFYGVDQSDGEALEAIASSFDAPLDLVIDDASHLVGPTRASFNRLFPHLRHGGVYVIEDTTPDRVFARPDLAADEPMTGLVLDIVRAGQNLRRAMAEITIRRDWVIIERGPADLKPGRFDIRNHL